MTDSKVLSNNSLPIELFTIDPEYEKETMRKIVHENADLIFLAGISKNQSSDETGYKLMTSIPKIFPIRKGSVYMNLSLVYPTLNSLKDKKLIRSEEINDKRQKKLLSVLPEGEDYLLGSFVSLCRLMNFYDMRYAKPTLKARARVLQSWLRRKYARNLAFNDKEAYDDFKQDELMKKHVSRNIEFLILTSLSEGKRHGYKIGKEAEKIFKSEIGSSSLYPALIKMEKSGLIKFEGWENSDDKPKKIYSITPMGERYRDSYMISLERLGNYIAGTCVDMLMDRKLKKDGIDMKALKEMEVNPLTAIRMH
jgi:DNA-binding PadR family transcriptional regulator